jgi:site-specific DNA recombinase
LTQEDLSRLGRNYAKTGYYTEEYFLEHGVRYIAVNDNVDTMKDDNDIAPFKNILNEMYAKDISRKVRAARAVNAKQGKFLGSKPPFGYTRCPTDKHKLIIDEKPAQIIARMFEMFASGDSGRHISDIFNKEGILSPRAYFYQQAGRENPLNESMTWNSNTVMQLLKIKSTLGIWCRARGALPLSKLKAELLCPRRIGSLLRIPMMLLSERIFGRKFKKRLQRGKANM